MRAFWDLGGAGMQEVPVADEAILLDLDTEEEYRRLAERSASEDLPTAEECRALMTQVAQVPEAVWRHCQATARVAAALAAAVNRSGALLDMELVRSAALVHDIAKTQAGHAAAGAKQLAALGFPRVAAVVGVHMEIATDPDQALDEAQLVFLADKLLEGERLSGLNARQTRKLAKYGMDSQAKAAIIPIRQAA